MWVLLILPSCSPSPSVWIGNNSISLKYSSNILLSIIVDLLMLELFDISVLVSTSFSIFTLNGVFVFCGDVGIVFIGWILLFDVTKFEKLQKFLT